MTSRAGRHLIPFGLAALVGLGLQAAPAAAQSYLADASNSGSVTVDYSVIGVAGPAGVTRSALPGGTCSCAASPMGVIAAAPRPTFNNPFSANLAMQAPAVPPGFMTYAQATGAPAYASNGGPVVLRAPSGSGETTEMTPPQPAPSGEIANAASMPQSTGTEGGETQPTDTQSAELPKTTQTQSESQPATGGAATSGGENPPAPADTMPQSVPSPVPEGQAATSIAPATQPSTEAPSTDTTTNTQTAEATTNTQATEAQPSTEATNTQAVEPATPPAPATDQQAAVTPTPAPATGDNAAPNGGALPAGAYRVLYTGDSDDVPAGANGDLDKVAASMNADQNMRVQILAYAAGTEDTESKARRKSLARGLAIRSYLIKAGVPSTRIDVRALGTKNEGGPADRVDIVPAS